MTYYFGMSKITPKYVELMQKLKQEGKRVGILSREPIEPEIAVDELQVIPEGVSKWDAADDKSGSILYDDDDQALNTWFGDRVKTES